jgi:hypothetical protein
LVRDPERAFGARIVGKRVVRPDELLTFQGQVLAEGDFSARKLLGFFSIGCRFERCKFERLRVEDAHFGAGETGSVYVECSFDGSRFRAPTPGDARFERCTFRDVRLSHMLAFGVEFVDCVFTGRAERCVFNGAIEGARRSRMGRDVNQFRGNDFSGMELRDVAFRTGIDLTQQQLPTGSAYVYVPEAEAAIARARASVSQWADDEGLTDALAILRWLEGELAGGEEQLFLDRPRRRDPVMTKVLDLLEREAPGPT